MIRHDLIERILRLVYGEQPPDDANMTETLVNAWIQDGIGIAAKQCYTEAIQLDGISYVNNSFYTTYRGLTFSPYEAFVYQTTLPQIPVGIGKNEGIASFKIKDSGGLNSYDGIPLSINQLTYKESLPKMPSGFLYWSEGKFIYVETTMILNGSGLTGIVRMISGGDSTDLNSTLNVPDDYIKIIIDYCAKMLILERNQPHIQANLGEDIK